MSHHCQEKFEPSKTESRPQISVNFNDSQQDYRTVFSRDNTKDPSLTMNSSGQTLSFGLDHLYGNEHHHGHDTHNRETERRHHKHHGCHPESAPPAPVDTKPPAPVDTKPPAPVDTKSPAPFDTKPPAPIDTKPPAPVDTNPAIPADSVEVSKFGARGDGQTDDTKAIQAAIDSAAPGSTVHIPAGTYMIDAGQSGANGLKLKSDITLVMDKDTVLKAIPYSDQSGAIINVAHANNVKIIGGTLQGERDQHTGSGGEWGMGLNITGSSNVEVSGVTAKDNWGDGFYVGSEGGTASTNITMDNIVADHNRRDGLSITNVDGMLVNNSRFSNNTGTDPGSGIDIEPNAGDTTTNIVIQNSSFIGNQKDGILSTAIASTAHDFHNVMKNNTFSGNKYAYWTDQPDQVFENNTFN